MEDYSNLVGLYVVWDLYDSLGLLKYIELPLMYAWMIFIAKKISSH